MQVDEVRERILRGETVRMGFAGGARVWWFEAPYGEIDDEIMRVAAFGGNGQPLLDEAGDCLFGWAGNSQTWLSIFRE